jgi:quercetin dioxygenase-like cupin family protein
MRKPKSKPTKRSPQKRRTRATASARRASARPKHRAVTPARRKTGAGGKGWKDTSFVISHLREEDFKVDGLRPYGAYRDLGVAQATNGMVRAHVIRNVRPFNAEDVSKRHFHDVDFQLVYCIKGSMKSEMNGQLLEIKAGTCWIQPPGIKHTVLDYSDDLELLEIIMPADFDTVEVPNL